MAKRSIEQVKQYTPVDREAFLNETLVQDAVLMRLQVIGEHLAYVGRADEPLFATSHDGVWNEVIGLRDHFAWNQEIEPERIWEFLAKDLPELERTIDKAIQHYS